MNQPASPQAHDDTDQDVAQLMADSAADFCARALPRSRLRALRGASPAFDRAHWQAMAELGWTGLVVPDYCGGLGAPVAAMLAVSRQLGAVAAPEPLLESAVAAAALLGEMAPDDVLLPALLSGHQVLVAALDERGGELFARLEVRAGRHAHVLSGTWPQLPLGRDADGWLLPAMLGGKPAWFHVACGAPGAELEDLPLADGSRDARLVLRECPARLLGSDEVARDAANYARVTVELASSAYLLGLAHALFDITREYLGTRQQFGVRIGSFQVLQHRMVDMYLQLRLGDAVVAEGAALVEQGGAVAARAASRARHRACHAALLIAREAVQLHGGIGYTDDCDVGLYLNRALVLAARYGNAAEHRALLAAQRGALVAESAKAVTVDIDAAAPDGDWNSLSDDAFRATVRGWFETNYPAALRNPSVRLRWAQCRDWYAALYTRGWAAPAWPTAHGGMGLNADKLMIFTEEKERWGVARTPDQGIIMIGPVLMRYGTSEQQAYYLPRALSGEHIWCQGYSEPNAGSDLASLRTRAIRDGDEYVITGQKIWTTLAQDATHMFCLVRTDVDAKPQAGISFVLIDLSVPGITIRPIRNIAGDEEFCEVFLDGVRIPVSALVGRENDGWTIAKALLGFERIFVGSPKTCQYALNRLDALATARGLYANPVFVDRLTAYALDVADLESLYKEFAAIIKRGDTLGADVSLLKIFASESFSRLSEFILECGGAAGACVGEARFGEAGVDVLSPYYNARPTPIYGGSNEIQRNIIAKQVLDLPSR
ncbi:MAG: acyl-CoA dehydrogenase [Proteobacteria bacterium]|nr:acyl-CoA dehydrogenase [Pseudomonadota bacterium]